ncbi:hypothetical protein MPTK2_7g02090 [Marchantia polymorpha subsp. ruderalis]
MADTEPESPGRRMSDFASSNNMSLTVMTFNLHRDRVTDGQNSWEHRKDLCASVINKFSPLIVCTQEGLKSQLDDLNALLPGYEQFGVSRKGPDDPSDEHCAIFYSRDKVEKMDGGTFWLSESPSVPASTSWSAEVPAIATWVTFQLRGVQPPGFAFQIVNTHLDPKSSRARRRGALLIWQHIATLPPNLPVIFCGTFNTVKESGAGRFLLGRSREHGIAGDLRDAWGGSRRRRNGGIVYTQHGFRGEKQTAMDVLKLVFMALCMCFDRQNQDLHVDWVLFRSRSLAPVYSEVVSDRGNNRYPSDHYPLYVEFQLPRSVIRLEEELN